MAGRGEATDACRVSRAPGDGGRSGCEQSEAETSWVRAPYAGQVTSFMMFHIHSLEARIESEMLAHHLPGFALAVVRGNEVWYARGFGVTSVEDAGLPVTLRPCSVSAPSANRSPR
jgi:CubicO group peptidase (beta-lactamase class C family)